MRRAFQETPGLLLSLFLHIKRETYSINVAKRKTLVTKVKKEGLQNPPISEEIFYN